MRPSPRAAVANARQAGSLVGPALVALLVSVFPGVQPERCDTQNTPVVCLSGVRLYIAELAWFRWHKVWARVGIVLISGPRSHRAHAERVPSGRRSVDMAPCGCAMSASAQTGGGLAA